MIQKPQPLPPIITKNAGQDTFTPKEALKLMLESSLRREQGLTTPLDEIDPMALDELVNRIDSGALALNQVPNPNDIEQLVQFYWNLRTKYNLEVQLGIVSKPRRAAAKRSAATISTSELFEE